MPVAAMPQHRTAHTTATKPPHLATEEQTAPRTREEKDLDEWNTLITALEAYKQEPAI